MPVNRYTFRVPTATATATTINIPIDMDFQLVDQGETIERQFVDVETEKAINPITDYEKVRFIPRNGVTDARIVSYDVNFWDGISNYYNTPNSTMYADIGFIDDDLRFRKNNLIKSVLSLEFYDSPIVTDQNLISVIFINPDIRLADININSQVTPASSKAVLFSLGNPLNYNEVFGEGFFIYHYKDEVDFTLPKDLYMRASFKNAKTGKRTNMMTEPFDINNQIQIDGLQGVLHTKYTLVRTQTGYYYELDTAQSNVEFVGDAYKIKLYEIMVA